MRLPIFALLLMFALTAMLPCHANAGFCRWLLGTRNEARVVVTASTSYANGTSRFPGTDKVAEGTFTQQSVMGGGSIWLTAKDSSYKGEFYYRTNPEDRSNVYILGVNVEGAIARHEIENILIGQMLKTNPQIKSVKVVLRPESRLNTHHNWDYENHEMRQFGLEIKAATESLGVTAFSGISIYQSFIKLGFVPDISKSGIHDRNDDRDHYFVWMTRVSGN
jgi:hypothetical protein